MPLYVFYNYWDRNTFNLDWLCGLHRSLSMMGCGAVYAQYVRQAINKKLNTLQEIAKNTYPWSCIFCCPLGMNDDSPSLPERAYSFLSRVLSPTINEEFRDTSPLTENPPSYIRRLLREEQLSDEEFSQLALNQISIVRVHS